MGSSEPPLDPLMPGVDEDLFMTRSLVEYKK